MVLSPEEFVYRGVQALGYLTIVAIVGLLGVKYLWSLIRRMTDVGD